MYQTLLIVNGERRYRATHQTQEAANADATYLRAQFPDGIVIVGGTESGRYDMTRRIESPFLRRAKAGQLPPKVTL